VVRTDIPTQRVASYTQPNGWMDEDATWYGSRPRRRRLLLDGFPVLRERGTAPPCFRPISIVATVAHLSHCWVLVSWLFTGKRHWHAHFLL